MNRTTAKLPPLAAATLLLLGASLGALAVASESSAKATSCLIDNYERRHLQLVQVEALDGGDATAELAFWEEEARLVAYSPNAGFNGFEGICTKLRRIGDL